MEIHCLTYKEIDAVIFRIASNWPPMEFERKEIGSFIIYEFYLEHKTIGKLQISHQPNLDCIIAYLPTGTKTDEESAFFQKFDRNMWWAIERADQQSMSANSTKSITAENASQIKNRRQTYINLEEILHKDKDIQEKYRLVIKLSSEGLTVKLKLKLVTQNHT